MSDFDFDGLLDGVLRDAANPVSPVGLEQRVSARVWAGRGRSSRKWMPWAAIAASAVAVGMLVWVGPNTESHVQRMNSSTALSRDAPVGAAIRSDAPRLQAAGSFGRGRRMSKKIAKSPPALLREQPLWVKPIEIAPLAIEPIEVASLTVKLGYERGEVR